MTLIKRSSNLLNALPMFFDDSLKGDLFNWNHSNFSETDTTIPAVNIKETPEHYAIEVAAPGLKKEDFKIELDGNSLTLRSEKSRKEEKNEEKYSRKEFSYESFQRTFSLHQEVVDMDKIEAKYEDGLLHLLIPKKEEAKPRPARQIEIA